MISSRAATTASELAAVRSLCWAYRAELMAVSEIERRITETFYPEPKYQLLMDSLSDLHGAPQGLILLALDGDDPVACGMLHALNDAAEIKRVYVTPDARSKGIAEMLCRQLEDHARAQGFNRLVLDTSRNLHGAQLLYERLGFDRCKPYQPIPDDVLAHLVFFEKRL